jgi:hypothetical protein
MRQIYDVKTNIRGVLGNKCAGQYNLKTRHFKEIIVLGNFWPWSSAICVFFAALSLPLDGGGEHSCSASRGDPLNTLLEGALGQ